VSEPSRVFFFCSIYSFVKETDMKLRLLGLLCVAMVFGLATTASADPIGFKVTVGYTGSYSSDWNSSATLPVDLSTTSDGMTRREVQLPQGGLYSIHAFDIYVSTQGLAADQDTLYTQFLGVKTGPITYDGRLAGAGDFAGNQYVIDPPSMGGSDAPAANWAQQITSNELPAFLFDVAVGATTAGPGGGTYGDYAAYLQLGETAPFKIGTMYLHTTEDSSMGFSFPQGTGRFKVIAANTTGGGKPANCSWVETFVGAGDVAAFHVVPEPSTIALLASGLMGLLCYAWRKRK
jgi:hypothetical protein